MGIALSFGAFLLFGTSGSAQLEVFIPTSGGNTISCGSDPTFLRDLGINNPYPAGDGYIVIEAGYAGVISLFGPGIHILGTDHVYIRDGAGPNGTILHDYTGTQFVSEPLLFAAGQTITVQLVSPSGGPADMGVGDGISWSVSYTGICSLVGIGENHSTMEDLNWLGQEGTIHRISLGQNQVDQISVYDVSGRMVNTSAPQVSGEQLLVDLNGQAPGIYMVHLQDEVLHGVLRLVHQ